MLYHSNYKAAYYIYKDYYKPSYSISLHKFTGSIHCTVKVRFFLKPLAPSSCLIFAYKPCVQICIYAHLLSRHRIQSKARRNLCYSSSTSRYNYKMNQSYDQENYYSYYVATSNHKSSKCLYDFTCRSFT